MTGPGIMQMERLNREMLAELRAVMEDEFDLLLETFFSDTRQRVELIESALSSGDPEAFSRACHSLKGSASNLGLGLLLELCRQGEALGRAGSLTGADALLVAIRAEIAEVTPLLRQEMAA